MGKEKITYEQMIQLLQSEQHKAPVSWDQIEVSLGLDQGISDLPTYKAPDNLWAGIEAGLDGPGKNTLKNSVEKSSNNTNGYLITAVVLLLGVIMYLLMHLIPGDTEPAFRYKSETEKVEMQNNFAELDTEIEDVLMYIEGNSFLFEDEKLAEFRKQLEELNVALDQISHMQENYGTDESSTRLMAKMERDKVNLIKSMITST